jgi:hypothetical protein
LSRAKAQQEKVCNEKGGGKLPVDLLACMNVFVLCLLRLPSAQGCHRTGEYVLLLIPLSRITLAFVGGWMAPQQGDG